MIGVSWVDTVSLQSYVSRQPHGKRQARRINAGTKTITS